RPLGHLVLRAHVDPDHPAHFIRGIRAHGQALFEVRLGRLAGHIDALARGVELPAVVDAAETAFLVATEVQRRATMWAERVDDADLTVGIAESDEVLAEGAGTNRVAVGC